MQQFTETKVWHLHDGQWISLAKRNKQGFAIGSDFTLTGSLPLPLNVQWRSDCDYNFKYGSPMVDGLRSFQFDTFSAGFGRVAREVKSGEAPLDQDINELVSYCINEDTSD